MAGIGDLVKPGGAVEQIVVWQIVGELVGALLAPYKQLLENEVNSRTQAVPLSPDANAHLVIRGYRDTNKATDEAKESGISPDDFHALVQATGNPISPAEAAEALRRKLIPEDSGSADDVSFLNAIRQGDLQNKWAPIVKSLATQIPSAAVIIEGLVTGQLTPEDARAKFEEVGGAPAWFDTMFHIAGGAPSPVEAGVAANRGIIPWEGQGPDSIAFHQAFLESRQRNKWEPVFRSLAEYHPPPRTVTALVREGSVTDQQAIKLWQQAGLSPELAGAYLASAHHQKTAAHHALSLSLIEDLYQDKLITKADAEGMIGDLGYGVKEVAFILGVQDLKRITASINRATNTIHIVYISHKIDRQTASAALDSIGIASGGRDELLGIWDEERAARVTLLSAPEIRKASRLNLLTEAEALARLVTHGYSAADAAIYMQL